MNACLARVTEDLIKLVKNGITLPNGFKANVRLAQYRCDNLEKNTILGITKNFSKSKFASSYSYIETEQRLKARKVEDILPENFEKRDETSYRVGCDCMGFNITWARVNQN